MQFSPYLKIFPCPDHPDQRLLYSTRKGSLLRLSGAALRRVEQGEEVPAEVMAALGRTGMLVADPAAEREAGRNLLAAVNQADPGLNVAVIVTLACNFSCPYCYEGSLKSRREMDEATAAGLVAYVRSRFRPGKRKIVLDFYGGEPLLAPSRIRQIAGPLQEFARHHGASFSFSLVTNGSLLTPRLAAELKEYGLRVAKVTLDGPAEIHNRSRPFRNGRGTFDRIVANLAACCELIKVGVQGNFTRESYQRVPELLDHLQASGLTPERLLQVNFSPVIRTSDQFALADFKGGCSSTSEPWVAEAAVRVREETMKRGYRVSRLTPSPCMVDLDDAFTVHVDGSLYKCMGFIGHAAYAVGDVWQGMKDYSAVYQVEHWRNHRECADCAYLPLCFGGCRYMEFQRQGAIRGVDCQKEFWDAALEGLVAQGAGRVTGQAAEVNG